MKRFVSHWGSFGLVAVAAVVVTSALALTLARIVVVASETAAPAAAPTAAPPSSAAASPSAAPPSAAPLPVGVEQQNGVTYYTVQPFDVGRREGTLAYLAARFNTTVAQLVRWNNIKDPNVIHPGQRLRVS